MYVMEEITVRLHKGQIVLVAEEISPSSLAVTQGKYSHRKRHGLAAYAQLDLTPVKLTLLSWLIILFDEDVLPCTKWGKRVDSYTREASGVRTEQSRHELVHLGRPGHKIMRKRGRQPLAIDFPSVARRPFCRGRRRNR